jgi:Na+/proline symporter
MITLTWKILGILAVFSLILFWKNKNTIWGGFTLGLIIGVIVAIIKPNGFDWYVIIKCGTIGSLAGAILEIGSMLLKRKN